MIKVIANKRHIYQRRPSMRGRLPDDQLDIKGREKRGVRSFQCKDSVWQRFGKVVAIKYGGYKKSDVIESLLLKWVEKEEERLFLLKPQD